MWKFTTSTVNDTMSTVNVSGGYHRLARLHLAVPVRTGSAATAFPSARRTQLQQHFTLTRQSTINLRLNSYHSSACNSFPSFSSPFSSSASAVSANAHQPGSRTATQQFCLNPYYIAAARLKTASPSSPYTLPSLLAAAGISSSSPSSSVSPNLDPAAVLKNSVAETAASLASNETAAEATNPMLLSNIDPNNPLIRFSSECLTWLQATTGLPWWATLVAAGLLTRAALFPLQLYQGKIAAGVAGLEPHFLVIDMKARQSPHPPFTKFMIVTRLKFDLYAKYNCNPLKMLVPTLVQMFVYVIMAASLRSMVHVNSDLATGGALWFTNLGIPDPTYALPAAAIIASYASSYYLEHSRKKEAMRIRTNAVETLTRKSVGTGSKPPEMFNTQKKKARAPVATPIAGKVDTAGPVGTVLDNLLHYARGLSLLLTPLVVQLPSGLFFFWLTSISWNVATTVLLRQPQVKQYLGYTEREEFLKNRATAMYAAREASNKPVSKPVVAAADEQAELITLLTSKPPASSSPSESDLKEVSKESLHKK